jgi:TatD DNase family protein
VHGPGPSLHHSFMTFWIDTHCHLDAAEFDADRDDVVRRGIEAGVTSWVLPSVAVSNFDAMRTLAHRHGFAYALGIHPLAVGTSKDEDLTTLRVALETHREDPRLVAVGEIGLDHFVPGQDQARAQAFYIEQLKLAREFDLPVIVHVRRSADQLLKHLRRVPVRGIAHAFNGSEQQAQAFVDLGFKLGFGGAMTFDRALQIRRIAQWLPDDALVLETDSPDIPPHWIYRTAQQRGDGAQARNEPAHLPRIAQVLADLRGWTVERTATQCAANSHAALPKLAALNALADSRA